jgi:hypothetical protein
VARHPCDARVLTPDPGASGETSEARTWLPGPHLVTITGVVCGGLRGVRVVSPQVPSLPASASSTLEQAIPLTNPFSLSASPTSTARRES